MNSGTVENCVNLRTVNATGTSCGGVVGNMIAGTVTDCINRGAMTFGGTWCGGIVGLAKSTGAGNLITNCVNEGTITSTNTYVGGVCGYLISNPGSADIVGCINRGAVSSTKAYVGGIAGYHETRSGGVSAHLNDSVNYAPVTGLSYVGGIAGYAKGVSGVPAYVDNCLNDADVTASGATSSTADCGGVVGIINDGSVTNCQNHGTVTSTGNYKNVGGIVGRTATARDITRYCYNDGNVVTTNSQKGGVIGGITSATSTASDNYWLSTTAAKAYGTSNGDSDVSFTAAQAAERDTFSALLLASNKWLFSTELELASFHTHTFNVAVSQGDAGHRLDCACGEHGEVVAHDFDDENTCTVCGYVQVECDHATTHDVITLVPTCATTGLKDVICDICGNTIASGVEVAVDPDNHVGHLVLGFNKNEAEEIDYYCDACDTVIVEDYNYATDIYVSATGVEIAMGTVTEDNLPGTEDNPFADFADAMTYAAYAAEQNKDAVTVHILDSAVAPANYATPASNYLITITGGELNFNTAPRRFFANGDITFEDITFKTNATDGVFMFGQNHNFTFGEGIVMGNATTTAITGFASINTVKAYVFGGFEGTATPAAMDTHLTVRSGNYWFIGGWNRTGAATTGSGHVTVGKTNANDELVTKYLVPFSTGDQLISADSESTIVVDGDIDVQLLYIGTQNAGSADKSYTTNFVLQGNISPNYPAYNGGLGFDITGTTSNKTGVNNVYVDERVPTAIVDSYAFFGDGDSVNPDTAVATMGYPTTYYTYIQYCANVLGGHVLENDVCTRCGFSASCAHESTHEEVTLAATCTTVGSKNVVCDNCFTILETIEIPVDPNNHVEVHGAVWSVDEDNGGYKLVCPACENAIVSGAEEPVVYLDNNTARSASVGDDNLDGLTEATAVNTFDEAFARLAVTGGRIVLADRYEISNTTTLPAHDRMVTISAVLNENGGATTGFLNKGHGAILNMNGPITFEHVVFNEELTTTPTSSGTYYKILTLAANWNDFTIGEGVTAFGGYYIVVGNSQATQNSGDETKTVNINLYRVGAGNTRLPDADSETGYKTGATAFYERIYLMDRYNGNGLVTKNKTVNATFHNNTAGTVYYATTSSLAQNAQMENCALNLTIGKKNDSDKGTGVNITELTAAGNMSGATGTAYLDNFTLNINDDVSKIATLGLYNLKNATINLSKASDGRTVSYAYGITVSQSDAYKAGAGADVEETVTANYGSHSFVKGKTIQVNEAYTLTRNVTDECTWDEGEITTAPAAGVPGVMTYTCTVCGRTKTEEIPFDCTTHTPIAKADGTYYCAVCGEVIDELRTADVVASVAPTEAVVGETFTMDVSLEATTPFWGAQFTVDAPEGFTLTDADFKIADAGEELTGNLAVLGGSEVALPYNIALIHMGTEEDTLEKTVVVTLTFAVDEEVEAGDYVITLTPVEAIRADEVTTLDMMTVSAEVSVTAEVAHVHELTLIPAVAADCTTAGNNAYYYCAG
ncbi:MAG: hypothetical protein IJS44_03245, partial [Clostridia bacterium]|nr:hypothetical protein [Clostridia bacterium]